MKRRDMLLASLGALGCAGLGACSTNEGSKAEPEAADPGAREATTTPLDPEPSPGPGDPLGDRAEIPTALWPAFDREGHEPPPSDLPLEGEAPQSYATFLAEGPPRPRPEARTIALLPIGDYPEGFIVEYEAVRLVRSPALAEIARFVEAWFGLPTRVLPAMSDELLESMPTREHEGRRQLDATALLDWLRSQRPPDVTCVLALTLEDLYDEGAQWLFGYASIGARVGVHSMLRYDPGFIDPAARGPAFRDRIRDRAMRVIAHEVAHMFGLRHCAHFRCLMNPTAGLEDLDALPLRLCPVCLRKLWFATGVGLVERWQALVRLGDAIARPSELQWFVDRLHRLGVSN